MRTGLQTALYDEKVTIMSWTGKYSADSTQLVLLILAGLHVKSPYRRPIVVRSLLVHGLFLNRVNSKVVQTRPFEKASRTRG